MSRLSVRIRPGDQIVGDHEKSPIKLKVPRLKERGSGTLPTMNGVVAQLARASRLQREGSGFESLQLHCVDSLLGESAGLWFQRVGFESRRHPNYRDVFQSGRKSC